MNSDELRRAYLEFFKSKGHHIIPSDSLIPTDDPSVLFTSAGMNQFKKQFMGQVGDFRRAATCQKCLRTDDLDKIGKTSYHHTFFEMLGNFSFGDYFKKEAISWAWEFLTQVLKINPDKLWVSVYKDDVEAFGVWEKIIKIPHNKIVKLGAKENFWPANAIIDGPNGPCGPCSEIFFDQGKDTGCKKSDCNPVCDCGRFVEIWNLVFTQFNRKDSSNKKESILEPLPNKNIDTGMGLERMAAVLQGTHSNFQIDIFKPIKKAILDLNLKNKNDELINIIADHIRAIVFAISDGVMPSNEERGYVLRKLIRKSFLCGRSLGLTKPFLYKIAPMVSEAMKGPYPELISRRENISQIILSEENSFSLVLENSINLLQEAFSNLIDTRHTGHIAFKLYDTHGIPLEIIENWLKEKNIPFNWQEFQDDLNLQKQRSKQLSKIKESIFSSEVSLVKDIKTEFLGYEKSADNAKILKIIKDDTQVKQIKENDFAQIILDKSVFYAESGGQVGDKGQMVKYPCLASRQACLALPVRQAGGSQVKSKVTSVFEVEDTKKIGQAIIHFGKVKKGIFKINQSVSISVDQNRRQAISRAHTATHLLQAALRQVLGQNVQQQGSLVEPDYLRFDFTHFKDVDEAQLERVQEIVFEKILANIPVAKKVMTLEKAQDAGALAFFQEKYDRKVRVIFIGDYSKELCGGTHLDFTSQIGFLKILSEGSVAKGIRRIEAITGCLAYEKITKIDEQISQIEKFLKVPKENIFKSIEKISQQNKEFEKSINQLKLDNIKTGVDDLLGKAREISGTKLIVNRFDNLDLVILRSLSDLIKQRVSSVVVILVSLQKENVFLVVSLSQDLINKNLNAANLIKELAVIVGGSGGGRADFAQGSGTNTAKIDELLRVGVTLIEEKLR